MRASLIDTVTILCDLYGELTALSSCRLPEKWHASVPRDAPNPGPTYRVLTHADRTPPRPGMSINDYRLNRRLL
jgi:hypothetical protein